MKSADRRRVGAEDHLLEDGAKALVEAQVDGEVDGRVGDDQGVADAAEVELEETSNSWSWQACFGRPTFQVELEDRKERKDRMES